MEESTLRMLERPLAKAIYVHREFTDEDSLKALEDELMKIDEQSRWAAFNSAMIDVLSHYYEKIGRWREGLGKQLEDKKIIVPPPLAYPLKGSDDS